MTRAHFIGGRDFNQFGGTLNFGALGFSDFVAATLFHETRSTNWVTQTGTKLTKKLSIEKSGFDTKHTNGFDTRGFDTQNSAQTRTSGAFPKAPDVKNKGSLIISPICNHPTKRKSRKKLTNRKKQTDETHFEHNGVFFEVITRSKSGKTKYSIYTEIMTRIIEQFDAAFSLHGRIFVQHIILSTAYYTSDNKMMTGFRKSLVQLLERKFGAKNTAYIWVREVENVKKQHYHVFVAVDGQKVWFKETMAATVKPIVKRSSYFTNVTLAGFHQVDDKASFNEMIYHSSYLAKTRGKGFRPAQSKDYGTSRLKPQGPCRQASLKGT
ncbi:YagK/YfjJ domain-containing protein [Thiomicrorhabdus xiamenensis]|uniref:Inovirus-type Gp2 protein n=1 Tax=Thiomicrorhabdus xiamenensis TaxID=2739063 RepID=A0A7D4P3Y4_9GAMM|nr:inovirus-type Gp2 protein [Thiomicrorhabdus xiamenensis]QKI88535.1 inovirus-type Gp2 protein [Thiomicrorhabdus xiamenensis]